MDSLNSHDQHFLSLFADTVSKYPSNIAVMERGAASFSYAQLRHRAAVLGGALRDSGVGSEDIVALCLEKSADYVAALLATWFAGAAFMPLDPRLPLDRIAFMLAETGAKTAIVQKEWLPLFDGRSMKAICSSDPLRGVRPIEQSESNLDALAYAIFTSGSTGKPKGVLVSHRGLVNCIAQQIEAFELGPHSRSLFYLSTNFDASLSDIGTAILSGATLCIEDPESLQPGADLIRTMHQRQITYVDIPPSLLRMLKPEDFPDSLQTIVIGGETCAPETVRAWASRYRMINVYGPTEATICTSMCQCDPILWNRALIGTPLRGVDYAILDSALATCADGVAGELYIGGIQLAKGYLNRPDLNAAKFVAVNGKRMYKTGDLVIRNSEEIQFIGRSDRLVKVRGMLVEPEEIEARLNEHPAIDHAAVLKRQLTNTQREGLVAFVITNTDVAPFELRDFLGRKLPRWMIPNRIEYCSDLPRTSTGKIDLQALKSVSLCNNGNLIQSQTEFRADANLLKEVFEQVLGVSGIGPDDDFFELGGDSFAVIEAVVAAKSKGFSLPPPLLMSYPTISAILEQLHAQRDKALTISGGMAASEIIADLDLSSAQWTMLLDRRRSMSGNPLSKPEQIFLTGATGFLGAGLLAQLLSTTQAEIYCLVRSSDEEAGRKRLLAVLANHSVSENNFARVIPVCGSLESPYLGLESSHWQFLCENIDAIYHCAAHVNMLLPYLDLRPANVGGMWEVIRLLAAGKSKWLHHASTLSVFVATDRNHGVAMEDDTLGLTNTVFGGYAQTKFAAEMLARAFEAVHPFVSHYRFGLITGDSNSGATTKTDFLDLFVKGITAIGSVPPLNDTICVDITPIDFACQSMAHISLSAMELRQSETYHIANKQSLPVTTIIDVLKSMGRNLNEVSAAEFGEALLSANSLSPAQSAACLALCRCLGDDETFADFRTMDLFQATDIEFDMTNTDRALAGSGIACPAPSKQLINLYMQNALSHTPIQQA